MNVVDGETAERDFDRWAESWAIETDVSDLEEDDKKSFNTLKRKMVRAIKRGSLTVGDDASELTYTLAHSSGQLPEQEPLVFKLPTGHAMLQFDKHKDQQNVHKLNAYLGSVTGQNPKIFSKMSELDLRICHAVALLFLASS